MTLHVEHNTPTHTSTGSVCAQSVKEPGSRWCAESCGAVLDHCCTLCGRGRHTGSEGTYRVEANLTDCLDAGHRSKVHVETRLEGNLRTVAFHVCWVGAGLKKQAHQGLNKAERVKACIWASGLRGACTSYCPRAAGRACLPVPCRTLLLPTHTGLCCLAALASSCPCPGECRASNAQHAPLHAGP